MDRGDFLLGVGTVVGGALLTVAIEFLRGWVERRQRQQDKRAEFQERTLLELQDTLDTLMLNGAMVVARRTVQWSRNWKYSDIPYNDPEAQAMVQAQRRLISLAERVPDAKVRELIAAIDSAVVSTATAESKESMKERWESVRERRTEANKRIGELLRSL